MENEIIKLLTAEFSWLEGRISSPRPMRVQTGWLSKDELNECIHFACYEMGLKKGHNVLGTDEGDHIGIHYIISGENNVLVTLCMKTPKSNAHIPTMTEIYPAFTLFERELEDLFGVKVEGLKKGRRYPLPDNWPKNEWPLRKEWSAVGLEQKMDAQKAQKIVAPHPSEQENLVSIPIGPQHPSLDEPSSFRITLEGERVRGAEIEIGYNHRGLEKACESRTYIQDLYIIERVCGICSHAHTTAYCMAVEELAGVEAPPRAQYIRLIAAELERLHSHLLWLGVAGHEIGFDTLFMLAWRDREAVLDIMAVLGGNRINYGINCLGGVRRDIDEPLSCDILAMLDTLEKEIFGFIDVASTKETLKARLMNVGRQSKKDCLKFGATGPVSRAAGVPGDVRVLEPYGAYREIRVNEVTDEHADVYGRTVVRLKEMLESIRLITEALKNMPQGELTVRVPRRIPAGEALVRVEAPRGEDMHFIVSDGSDKPARVRVRAPSECNWHGMQHMLEGGYLADVPITIAAIDPCYSCTDRAIRLEDGRRTDVITWQELRRHGIEWYMDKGVEL